jgi:hypothetical protein
LAVNQAVSYTNLQDAVTNGIFTLVSAITSTGQESTKSYVGAHVSGFNANYPPYAIKASNQLIVQGDIYNTGDFILDAAYGMSFTSMTGSVGGLPTFTFPVTTGNTTKTYNNTIAAQTITLGITGTRVSPPQKVVLLVNGIQVDCKDLTVNGVQTKVLTLPNAIYAPSSIKISMNLSACVATPIPPPPNFSSGYCFSTVSVNRGSGQYMVAGMSNLYSSSGWVSNPLFYSSNYGSTWTQSSISGYWIKVASSDNGQYVLALEAYGKAYLSSNYGVTFSAISSLGTIQFNSAALSGTGQYQIIVGGSYLTGNVFIKISSDYGVTWTSSSTGFTGETYYSCAIDSAANNLLIGGGNNGISFIYRSTNNGTTWTQAWAQSGGSSVNDINIYANGSTAIASQYGSYTSGAKLILSTNSGASWANITGGSANNSWLISIIPNTSPTVAYALYYLGNTGTSYIQKVSTLSSVGDLTSSGNYNWHSIAVSDNGTYILGGTGNGLYLSTNSGSTFSIL